MHCTKYSDMMRCNIYLTEDTSAMNAQTEKYLEPVREINALALENVEKLLDIQLESINDTARLGVEQLKSATDIKDADSLKQYFTDQADLVKSLGERFVKDTQAALELGTGYSEKVRQIMTETIKPETILKAAAARTESATDAKAAPKSK